MDLPLISFIQSPDHPEDYPGTAVVAYEHVSAVTVHAYALDLSLEDDVVQGPLQRHDKGGGAEIDPAAVDMVRFPQVRGAVVGGYVYPPVIIYDALESSVRLLVLSLASHLVKCL